MCSEVVAKHKLTMVWNRAIELQQMQKAFYRKTTACRIGKLVRTRTKIGKGPTLSLNVNS